MAGTDYPMNDGRGPSRDPFDMGQAILSLDNTLASFTSQMSSLTKAMEEQRKRLSDITTSNEKFYREFTRSNRNNDANNRPTGGGRNAFDSVSNMRNIGAFARDIEEFRQEVANATRQIRRESREWKYSNRSFKESGADVISARRRQRVLEDYGRAYTEHQKYMEARFKQEEDLYKNRMEEFADFNAKTYETDMAELRSKRKKYESISKTGETEEIRSIAKSLVGMLTKEQRTLYQKKQGYDTEQERHNEQMNSLQEETKEALKRMTQSRDSILNGIDRLFKEVEDSFDDAQEGINALRGRSASINKFMEDLETSKEEKFNDAVERARDQVADAIKALQDKLKDDKDLNDAERENIEKKIKILEKEDNYLRKLTPVTDIWRNVGQEMKNTLGDGLLNTFDPIFKNIEDKYLQSYIDGFQKVYDSIENTRNTISARLKLNSGDYKEMQEALYQQIQDRGLSGSVSLTDVDDMIVSLQTAGITDQQMLQELAIEGAKLKAQGSSLDLGNEETLQQIMKMYSSSMQAGLSTQEALDSITNMMDELSSTEIGIRQEFGYDAALVNGGLNTIFNQAAKMGTASGKDIEQIKKDVESSAFASQALYSSGIDESLIRQSIQSIFDQTVGDQDVFAKMLISQGINRDTLVNQNMDLGEAMQYVTDRMGDILNNADPKYIAEIGKAYALPGNVTDWLNMQQKQGALSVTPSDAFRDSLDEITQTEYQALQQGEYLSETAKRQKEQENKATEKAIDAEQMYKGDQLVVGELQNIGNIVNSMYGLMKGGLKSSLESITKGGLEAFGRAGVNKGLEGAGELTGSAGGMSFGQGATQFLTGQSGTALGAAGKIAGGAVGAYWMYDSLKDNIDAENSFWENFGQVGSDPQFYRGLGTTLGSAIAGPVGGAIGGVIGQAASQLGNALGDKVAEGWYNWFNDTDDVVNAQLEAATRLSEAGASLDDAAKRQAEEIQSAKTNITNQKEIFNKYDESQQKQFITQMGIDATGMDNQEAFKKAIEKWEQIELRKLAEMELKQRASTNTSVLSSAMDKTIDTSLFDTTKEAQEEQIKYLIEAGLIKDEDIQEMFNEYGVTGLSKKQKKAVDEIWQQEKERQTDMLKVQTEQGYQELATIEEQALRNYAQANNLYGENGSIDLDSVRKQVAAKGDKLDIETATKQLYSEQVDAGTLTAEDVSQMTNYFNVLAENRNTWEADNKLFQDRWKRVVDENPGKSIVELVDTYNKEHLDGKGISVSDVIDGFTIDSVGLSAEYTKGNDGLPQLRSKSGSGTRLYDPALYHGKFESGLTEVPFDMYPAMLHEGERVLTAKEADAYNELSSYAVRQLVNQTSNNFSKNIMGFQFPGSDEIKGSIDSQTKSTEVLLSNIIDLMNQLLKRVGSTGYNANPVNPYARAMNTNLTANNTRL